jgi:hypothetical protein
MIWAIIFFPSVTCRCRYRCRCKKKFMSRLQPPALELESWKFGPEVFSANLMHFILRILKFRFLRVATKERFLKFCCLSPNGRFSWPENGFIVFRMFVLVKKNVVRFILGWIFFEQNLESQLRPRDFYGK